MEVSSHDLDAVEVVEPGTRTVVHLEAEDEQRERHAAEGVAEALNNGTVSERKNDSDSNLH